MVAMTKPHRILQRYQEGQIRSYALQRLADGRLLIVEVEPIRHPYTITGAYWKQKGVPRAPTEEEIALFAAQMMSV